jgi:hypothetical protein
MVDSKAICSIKIASQCWQCHLYRFFFSGALPPFLFPAWNAAHGAGTSKNPSGGKT